MKVWRLFLAGVLATCASAWAAWPKPPCIVEIGGTTYSMGRALRPGDRVKLQPVTPGADLVGFVVYRKHEAAGTADAHRVIAQGRAANGKMWYVLKGDANWFADEGRADFEEIVGVFDLPRKLPKGAKP